VNSVLYFTSDEDIPHFYQMNALWNVVNLGIAGLGYWGSVRAAPSEDLFRGYGQSLLQGGFLLVFDLVMYAIQRGSRNLIEPLLNEKVRQ